MYWLLCIFVVANIIGCYLFYQPGTFLAGFLISKSVTVLSVLCVHTYIMCICRPRYIKFCIVLDSEKVAGTLQISKGYFNQPMVSSVAVSLSCLQVQSTFSI